MIVAILISLANPANVPVAVIQNVELCQMAADNENDSRGYLAAQCSVGSSASDVFDFNRTACFRVTGDGNGATRWVLASNETQPGYKPVVSGFLDKPCAPGA